MDVLAALKNGTATIVDVRSREEFQSGHVAGSINIPLQEVPTKVEELKKQLMARLKELKQAGKTIAATAAAKFNTVIIRL